MSIHESAPVSVDQLKDSVTSTGKWLCDWRLGVNEEKTVLMDIQRRNLPLTMNICLNGFQLYQVQSQRHLDMVISSDKRWKDHIERAITRGCQLLGLLKRLRNSLTTSAPSSFFCTYIRPTVEYASVVWCGIPQYLADKLEQFRRKAARVILAAASLRRQDAAFCSAREVEVVNTDIPSSQSACSIRIPPERQ